MYPFSSSLKPENVWKGASLSQNTLFKDRSNMKHESSLKEKSSLDVTSRWEDINRRWLFSQLKKKWSAVSGDLASNELAAGLAVVKGWGVVVMRGVWGEMSFRLCEVSNYLRATRCRHDESALALQLVEIWMLLKVGARFFGVGGKGEWDLFGPLVLAER